MDGTLRRLNEQMLADAQPANNVSAMRPVA
jgi:hypothetical protein